MNRRDFIGATLVFAAPSQAAAGLDALRAGWNRPPRSCRPHTRWWWPGSAVSRGGIAWQLDQMQNNGIGGVEIISIWNWYETGNVQYLSDEWLELVRYTIDEAGKRDMEVAITFGPGWDFGGFWVPPQDRAKVLAACWVDVEGPTVFDGVLPQYDRTRIKRVGLMANAIDPEGQAPDEHQIVAVAAGRWEGSGLAPGTLTDLTARLQGETLQWQVPAGKWRITAFRLEYNGQQTSTQNYSPRNWIVDHFNAAAVKRFADYLAGTFQRAFGSRLGRVVDSFFGDSFEVTPLPDSILWSNGLLEAFASRKGYDLRPYLPALWWPADEITPRVRYDVNHFLHEHALEATYRPLRESMAAAGVDGRFQPHYRFSPELIQAAGATPRPETEVTTARFEVVTDPRKATVAGARFYGRKWVSAEAYTFIHQQRYRATLEEMKRATDAFLRDGITQLYNHGYLYSEEKVVSPIRDVPFAERISHWNPWWPHYKHLAAYVARGCFLLRQGKFVGEILLYTPQNDAWCEKAVWGMERRVMNYGDVPRTLVANGYDFDPVNDDVLQNLARFAGGSIQVNGHAYRVLILQRARAVPVPTLRAIARAVEAGVVVIALDSLPSTAPGMANRETGGAEVSRLVQEIWRPGRNAHFLESYKFTSVPFFSNEQPPAKTPPLDDARRELLRLLGTFVKPSMLLEGGRQSDGLTFHHRRDAGTDIYFVANLQPEPVRETISFNARTASGEVWDGITGEMRPVAAQQKDGRAHVEIELAPWESRYFLFAPGLAAPPPKRKRVVQPAVEVRGPWQLSLEGIEFPPMRKTLDRLSPWSDLGAAHCSGTGVYTTSFELSREAAAAATEWTLDLGEVAYVAEIFCNGRRAGVCWMQPYRIALTGLVRAGENRLEIRVTNLLLNFVAGLDQPPGVPSELASRYGDADRSHVPSRTLFEKEKSFRPLPPGGLLGPVSLQPVR